MPRINKIKRDKAVAALVAAGMAPSTAARYVRMLDLDKPLAEQIAELAEDMADLFGATDEDDTEDTDDEPMTAAEALRSRLSGGHRLRPARPEGSPAQQNAAALGATRARPPRPTTAPATAQAAAARLRAGIGRAADGS
ncbi:hypothetical protein [Streptomyces sp. NPDC059166]|uniref:hypothetical protein n=1 Tax=Streptomyces sp. NPDC059166 TaxID=3346752 RepID=UPI0036C1C3CC